jgi:hypothetical protein
MDQHNQDMGRVNGKRYKKHKTEVIIMTTGNKKTIGILLVFMSLTLTEFCSAQYDQRIRTQIKEGPKLEEEYPELTDLKGSFKDYHYEHFPVLEYEMPDIQAWVSSLEPVERDKADGRYISVWSENDKIRYIFIWYAEGIGQFYAMAEDSIEFVVVRNSRIDVEATPNGVFRWRYIYNNDGLLQTAKFFGGTDVDAHGSGFNVIKIRHRMTYWEDTGKLKHLYLYNNGTETPKPDDQWDSREDYDREGNWIKTTLPGEE